MQQGANKNSWDHNIPASIIGHFSAENGSGSYRRKKVSYYAREKDARMRNGMFDNIKAENVGATYNEYDIADSDVAFGDYLSIKDGTIDNEWDEYEPHLNELHEAIERGDKISYETWSEVLIKYISSMFVRSESYGGHILELMKSIASEPCEFEKSLPAYLRPPEKLEDNKNFMDTIYTSIQASRKKERSSLQQIFKLYKVNILQYDISHDPDGFILGDLGYSICEDNLSVPSIIFPISRSIAIKMIPCLHKIYKSINKDGEYEVPIYKKRVNKATVHSINKITSRYSRKYIIGSNKQHIEKYINENVLDEGTINNNSEIFIVGKKYADCVKYFFLNLDKIDTFSNNYSIKSKIDNYCINGYYSDERGEWEILLEKVVS